MKNISYILFYFLLLLFSCKSLKNNFNNPSFKIVEGKGLSHRIEIGYTKRIIDRNFPQSDDCEIIVGKYYKINDNNDYIDDRKIISKKVNNRRCFKNEGINVFFQNDSVTKIEFFSKEYYTEKGVRINDHIRKVFKLYGDKPQYTYYAYLFHKKNNIGLNNLGLIMIYYDRIGIAFVMNKSGKRVKRIVVFKPALK